MPNFLSDMSSIFLSEYWLRLFNEVAIYFGFRISENKKE
ncbi:hypothetical protein A33Q_4277 [Indibacter alkaliphilus LW1]|uniref:Uncharacterized protein n=1 Tax=Indibacter alkaliphilus (strain CCUG 57479 / KCTC 22604 / LW1) TaxID=1189612 RepID=S2CZZ7_INDAL|nr:hypothetical protein A33Q_4277 [Indibacter alkaliphilus LW1]